MCNEKRKSEGKYQIELLEEGNLNRHAGIMMMSRRHRRCSIIDNVDLILLVNAQRAENKSDLNKCSTTTTTTSRSSASASMTHRVIDATELTCCLEGIYMLICHERASMRERRKENHMLFISSRPTHVRLSTTTYSVYTCSRH